MGALSTLRRKVDQTNWKTTKKERIKFYIGDIGRVASGSIVTTFMSMFLMLQGIPLTWVATALLLVNVIDSVDDVIFGYLIDKINIRKSKFFRKITGEGKYLPWFRLMFPFFPIFTICFFLMPAQMTFAWKIVWFIVFDLLYDFSYTVVEVPMNSMVISLTDNVEERNSIIQTKTILSSITTMFIPMIWLLLVSQEFGLPLVWVASVSAVILFFFMLPLTRGVKEHNLELANAEDVEHYSFKDMFKCVFSNKYLLLFLLALLASTILGTSAGSIGLFASYYIFGNELILVIPIICSFPFVLIAQFCSTKLVARFGKIPCLLVGGAIGVAGFLGIYFFGSFGVAESLAKYPSDGMVVTLGMSAGWVVILCILLVVQAGPGNVYTMVRNFLLPDTIEYARFKNGKDCSGIITSLNSFVSKLGTSLASSVGLFILGLSGWVPITATDFADLAAQQVAQPVGTIQTLWVVYALIPTIGNIISVICMCFYNLKDKDAQLMANCNAGLISKDEAKMLLTRSYDKSYKISTIDQYAISSIHSKLKKYRKSLQEYSYIGEKFILERKCFPAVNCYIYRPEVESENRVPLIIALHNGAFVDSSASSIDSLCNELSKKNNALVINVDYTPLDEQRFPYQQREIVDLIRYFYANADEYSIDSNNIKLVGFGAGASIAAGCIDRLTECGLKVSQQLLFDPILDFSKGLPTQLFNNKVLDNIDEKRRERNEKLIKAMAFGGTDPAHSLISPLYASDEQIKNNPSTIIYTYGNDGLKDQAEAYASRLNNVGVSCKIVNNLESSHIYWEENLA